MGEKGRKSRNNRCFPLLLETVLVGLPSDTKTGARCLVDCAPPPPIYYMPYPHPYCTIYTCISACWYAPIVSPLHLHLLIATLCIIAPLVHITRPSMLQSQDLLLCKRNDLQGKGSLDIQLSDTSPRIWRGQIRRMTWEGWGREVLKVSRWWRWWRQVRRTLVVTTINKATRKVAERKAYEYSLIDGNGT